MIPMLPAIEVIRVRPFFARRLRALRLKDVPKFIEAFSADEEVDYINAHGTGTHHNDLFETRAVRRAFGASADHVKMSSTKSMIGHLLGAAGAVELIVCVKSIEEGYIHPTVGTTNPGEGCDLDYVINGAVEQEVNVAISNSLGFGGHNASLLVKKYEE